MAPAAGFPDSPPLSRLRSALLPWRAMRIALIVELTQPSRYVPQLTMVVTQLALTWWLWRALYAGVRVSAGLDVSQATSYALLGVLYLQFKFVDRWSNGDMMVQLMFEGTIAYWFTRPVSPRRWYLIRMSGELAYGGEAHIISGGQIGEVTQKMYDTLTGIQLGKIEDKYGWVTEVPKL